jgi:hypothetical protein
MSLPVRPGLEFILGLLDQHDPAYVSHEDMTGAHGPMVRLWQRLGFLGTEPERHPVPSCPYCREGEPVRLGGQLLCRVCGSAVDEGHLFLWRFNLEAFLTWLARALRLEPDVRLVGERLLHLGRLRHAGIIHECFFCRSGPLSDRERTRLLAYHHALVFLPLPGVEPISGFRGPCLSLLELLEQDRQSLKAADVTQFLREREAVCFDAGSGALWVGGTCLGEVPFGRREYFFLEYLAMHLDRFVPYGDIKHHVLERSGCIDSTEEATFCQNLKSRIKKKWIPKIDRLIATTSKGEGYRLRAFVGAL